MLKIADQQLPMGAEDWERAAKHYNIAISAYDGRFPDR